MDNALYIVDGFHKTLRRRGNYHSVLGYKGLYCTRLDVLNIYSRNVYNAKVDEMRGEIEHHEIFPATTFTRFFPIEARHTTASPHML